MGSGHKKRARAACGVPPPSSTTASGSTSDDAACLAYKRCVAEMYLKNEMSAKRTQQLVKAAQDAGARGAERMARAGGPKENPKDMSRDIMRGIMKDTPAPPLYWAAIPTHDPRSKKNRVPVLFPFSLPHEMIYIFLQMRRPLCASMGELPASVAATLQKTARSLKTTTDGLVPIGFHGDAAPNQAHGSVLCFSWNILNTPDSERFLCTAIQSDFLCQCGCGGRCTIDAIVRVFVWSANTAFTGSFPASRHDATPWGSSFDRWRKALANNALGFRALLQQCRGDWAWYKQLFSFPSWASKLLCWRCRACQDGEYSYKNFGLKAAWRRGRLTATQFFSMQREQGIEPSPLFQAVGFSLSMVTIDVLHCMDLGCSQDILGNLFVESLGVVCLGKNKKEQVAALWGRIRRYYDEFSPPTRLQALSYEMLRQDKKGPKLRAKGADTRHLVPFAAALASELNDALATQHTRAVLGVVSLLLDIYMLFSLKPFNANLVGDLSRKLCVQYAALSHEAELDGRPKDWRTKPKFHTMSELLEYQTHELEGSPTDFWAYKDEDFVGWIADISCRRGGPSSAASAAESLLKRYSGLAHMK